MDPNETWDVMLSAYATKQWHEAFYHAEALLHWLQRGGFPPQPTIGTTKGDLTCQLDTSFNRAIAEAGARQIMQQSKTELGQ